MQKHAAAYKHPQAWHAKHADYVPCVLCYHPHSWKFSLTSASVTINTVNMCAPSRRLHRRPHVYVFCGSAKHILALAQRAVRFIVKTLIYAQIYLIYVPNKMPSFFYIHISEVLQSIAINGGIYHMCYDCTGCQLNSKQLLVWEYVIL